MRIVKLKGGLGNQMFQYSFAKLIKKRTHDDVKIDLSSFGNLKDDLVRRPRILKFKITLPIATSADLHSICKIKHSGNSQSFMYRAGIAVEKTINPKYYFESDRAYRSVDDMQPYLYFDGYWQSWRYVNEVWDELKEEFTPNYQIEPETREMIGKVKRENSVFVGVRRGDYLTEKNHYGSYGQEYYDKAFRVIEEKIDNPVYYIFSNDIAWVKGNLEFGKRNIIFREPEQIVDDFEDLLIMMNCRHSIILNSTYHWWGGRMNDAADKLVVAPKKWFQDNKPIDIVPPHWVRV